MTFASTFGRVLSPTFQPKSQAAVVASGGWWDLDGTITSCIAAYQPKGAADYAASKVNLVNPGTYNCSAGSIAPTWDATNGWKFAGGKNEYLNTSLVLKDAYTIIIRFSNVTNNGYLMGSINHSAYVSFCIAPNRGSPPTTYFVRRATFVAYDAVTSGVLAQAKYKGFYNGSPVADLTSLGDLAGDTFTAYIGATHDATTPGYAPIAAYIQCAAIYSTTLTDTQIGNLTTAMNAL